MIYECTKLIKLRQHNTVVVRNVLTTLHGCLNRSIDSDPNQTQPIPTTGNEKTTTIFLERAAASNFSKLTCCKSAPSHALHSFQPDCTTE